jgi:Na+-transporting NADH:ubiquinone oxidoreductase subunit NqrC
MSRSSYIFLRGPRQQKSISISSAILGLRETDSELERSDRRLSVLRINVLIDIRVLDDGEEDVADEMVKAEMIDDRGDDGTGVLAAGES